MYTCIFFIPMWLNVVVLLFPKSQHLCITLVSAKGFSCYETKTLRKNHRIGKLYIQCGARNVDLSLKSTPVYIV